MAYVQGAVEGINSTLNFLIHSKLVDLLDTEFNVTAFRNAQDTSPLTRHDTITIIKMMDYLYQDPANAWLNDLLSYVIL
jgi:hypothetical protein